MQHTSTTIGNFTPLLSITDYTSISLLNLNLSHDATDRIFYFSSFCNYRLLAVILFVLLSGPSQRISSHLLTWLGFISFCVPSSRGHTCIFALKVFYIFIFLTVSVPNVHCPPSALHLFDSPKDVYPTLQWNIGIVLKIQGVQNY